MSKIYPCHIIITCNEEFIDHYNSDPGNALTASQCMTVEEGFCLLEEKVKIETITLINKEGEELIAYLGEQCGWDKQKMPDVLRITAPRNQRVTGKEINDSIAKSSKLHLGVGAGVELGVYFG